MNTGVLYLAPVLLGDADPAEAIPSGVQSVLRNLRRFIAEEPKAARAFLKSIGHPGPLADLAIDRLAADATPISAEDCSHVWSELFTPLSDSQQLSYSHAVRFQPR